MAVRADQNFWFNGQGDFDHTNWGAYWAPIVSSGVLGDLRNKMQITANSSGMMVYAATGEVLVYGVRGIFESTTNLAIATASGQARVDLVVARAVFGNEGESYIEIAVKTGTPASSPAAPALTLDPGQLWEIPLAEVRVDAGVATIAANKVTDKRTWAAASGMREQTVSIAVGDWNGSLQATKTVTGVAAGELSKVWDSPAEASRGQYLAADVRLLSNGTNSVTWKCTIKPTAALTVTVVWAA